MYSSCKSTFSCTWVLSLVTVYFKVTKHFRTIQYVAWIVRSVRKSKSGRINVTNNDTYFCTHTNIILLRFVFNSIVFDNKFICTKHSFSSSETMTNGSQCIWGREKKKYANTAYTHIRPAGLIIRFVRDTLCIYVDRVKLFFCVWAEILVWMTMLSVQPLSWRMRVNLSVPYSSCDFFNEYEFLDSK